MQRVLMIMRHAKAEPYAASDHERRLTEPGAADAAEAGAWLGRQPHFIDHALVSSAVRTIQTWELVAEAAGWGLEPVIDSALYSAGPETALDLIRAVPSEATGVLVIGHNPTMAYLANLLDGGDGDAEASAELASGSFPAATIAVFGVKGEWADLDEGGAQLLGHHVGRG